MNELISIRQKLETLVWEGHLIESVVSLPAPENDFLEHLIPGDLPGTLCWEDIDYADRGATDWKPSHHYRRLIAILLSRGRAVLEDDLSREKILSALRYFILHDFQSSNWWHNQIGMPRNMADLALLLGDALPAELFDALLVLLRRGSLGSLPPERHLTGANRIWLGATTLRIAALTGDAALMRLGQERIAEEVCFAEEGVQPDGSFFQHGPRLYSGGYGRCFAYDMAQLLYVLDGTSYQFSEEQRAVVETHIADGLRYMSQGAVLDWQCLGRNYTRPGNQDAGILRAALRLLSKVPSLSRAAEISAYRESVEHGTPFSGTKYFPDAALLCHHTGSLYVGAKFLWGRLWDEEICNGEGILGYNLSYGTHHCAMVTGREYYDIAPLWRYDRIPGTTARTEDDAALLAHATAWASRTIGQGGGAQNGDIALIWEAVTHETVSGFTADFAFPGGFVSMNAAFRDTESAFLTTTLDQCFAADNWETDGSAILHAGIRYQALDDSVLIPEIKTVTGSWKRNSTTESPAPVSGTLFTLTVSHPDGNGACAYLLSPADAPAPAVTLLSNTAAVQALRLADGRILAVCREAAVLTLPDGGTLRLEPGIYLDGQKF